MIFKDFTFNFRSNLISFLKKKYYLSFLKRLFLLPYKYILSNLRNIFINKNIDKINFSKNDHNLNNYLTYFDCDKSSLVHGYSKFYELELEKLKDSNLDILEFGIHFGASQAAFSKYFNRSNIIGVDKNPYYKKFFSKNIRSLYCDVSDQNSLKLLKDYLGIEFDLIIDDASHIPKHQLKTSIEMFDVVKSKGLYVVEELDIFESYPENYNKNLDNNVSEIREILHHFKDKKDLNLDEITHNIQILSLAKKIEWVKIFRGDYFINDRNVSEIAFIKKK